MRALKTHLRLLYNRRRVTLSASAISVTVAATDIKSVMRALKTCIGLLGDKRCDLVRVRLRCILIGDVPLRASQITL
jgi:hypothetical protein